MDSPTQRIEPGPGQESVWDYPRPPRVEPGVRKVTIIFAGEEIVQADRTFRVLETAGAPAYYVPLFDLRSVRLVESGDSTVCEWKGEAVYYDLVLGGVVSQNAAWAYPEPKPGYEMLKYHLAFHPDRVDVCYLDDEAVTAQPGGYYGGWVTSDIVGPFKGEPGTEGW